MARLQSIYNGKCGERRIGHNTRVETTPSGFVLTYHQTGVVRFYGGSDVRRVLVNTGGWFSVTTAQRIRHGLREIGLSLTTENGKWRVEDRKGNAWTIRGTLLSLEQHIGRDWQRRA